MENFLTISRQTCAVTQYQILAGAGPQPGTAPSTLPPSTFETRAAELFGGRSPAVAGKLRLTNFAEIRDRFGAEWPKMSPKAEETIRSAIERRLGPGDVYRRGSDLDFAILFAAISPQEARLKCAQIAEEAVRTLKDDLETEAVALDAGATVVDSKAMQDVLQRSGNLADALFAEIARASAHQPASGERSSILDRVRFVFRPIWDVKRGAAFNFFCLPVIKSLGGRIVAGESAVEGLDDRHTRLDYDLRLLRRVMDELMQVGAGDRRLLFTVPVHVDTVSFSPFRAEYLRLWREVPLSLQRLAVFDLVGGTEGFPQSRLIEILPSLKPASRGVTLRLPLSAASGVGRFGHVGLHAVSSEVGPAREVGAQTDLEKFAAAAARAHLLTYLHGARTAATALAAVGAGFSFIDGPAIGSAAASPAGARRFSVEDLSDKN